EANGQLASVPRSTSPELRGRRFVGQALASPPAPTRWPPAHGATGCPRCGPCGRPSLIGVPLAPQERAAERRLRVEHPPIVRRVLRAGRQALAAQRPGPGPFVVHRDAPGVLGDHEARCGLPSGPWRARRSRPARARPDQAASMESYPSPAPKLTALLRFFTAPPAEGGRTAVVSGHGLR